MGAAPMEINMTDMIQQNSPLVFLGSSSNLELWVELAERAGVTIIGIIDSDYFGNTDNIAGIPIIGSQDQVNFLLDLATEKNAKFFIATNWDPVESYGERDNQKRLDFIKLAEDLNLPLGNLIDPLAVVPKSVVLYGGVYIGAFVVLEPHVQIGKHTQVWYHSSIGHHTQIGDDCVLQRYTKIWGTKMGNHSYLSMGATYAGNYKTSEIGENVFIHPGLVIAGRPIADNEVVTIRESLKNRRRTFADGNITAEEE